MYRMLRVFCATAWELEGERLAFYDVVGQFNEEAMKLGILYVPVSLTNAPDKRPLQYTVNQNIRDCRHYILATDEDWGPRERNFERDYRLAIECAADATLPMKGAEILVRTQPDGSPSPFGSVLSAAGFPCRNFSTTSDFVETVKQLLSAWLPVDAAEGATAPASA
jgi:hypothetical protein